MIEYIVKHLVISGILLLVYYFLYRQRDQLLFNRWFILSASLFSAIVPFIKIDAFPVYQTLSLQTAMPTISRGLVQSTPYEWSLENIYWMVAGLLVMYSCYTIIATYKSMARKHQLSQSEQYDGSPMSFFHFIAVPNPKDSIVIAHEQYHVLAGHSFDRMLFSLFQAILWINPLLFLYKRYLIENHELAADQYSIKVNSIDQVSYSEHLVAITKQNIALPQSLPIPNHYYSLILNRIQMLHSKKSSSHLLNGLSLLIFAVLFCSFTLKTYSVTSLSNSAESSRHDTLPDISKLIIIDTITTFNSDTYEETVQIVKNYSPSLEEYLNKIDYSGNMISVTDTITTLNYDTYEELVQIVKYVYPVEISELIDKSDYNDWKYIIGIANKAAKK